MTAGLWALLLVLAISNVVGLLLRRRAIVRREWASEEPINDAWLDAIRSTPTVFGMRMVVSHHLPAGVAAIMVSPEAFQPPHLRLDWSTGGDVISDLLRARNLIRAHSTLVVRPSAAAVILGSAL